MTVGIYRNRLNQEIKKFGKFTKVIEEKCNSDGKFVEIIFEDKKNVSLDKLLQHDTLVFVTHGDSNNLYHRYCENDDRRNSQVLLSSNDFFDKNFDTSIYDDKVIIAISCCTAKELGAEVFKKTRCKAYIGFRYNIHFNRIDERNGMNKSSKKYYMFLLECYKEIFSETLTKAIINEWTVEKFKQYLEFYSKRCVGQKAKTIKNNNPRFYENHKIELAVRAITHVADNIVLYNHEDVKII